MPDQGQPVYRLTLRAQPGAVPPVVRLRRLLKTALRSFGLRCLAVEEVRPDDPEPCPDAADAAPGEIRIG
jgi:hypothetical protein